MSPASIDPILLEVLRNRLDAIADEMELTLLRSAASPIVKEGLDASAALFNVEGTIYALDGICRHAGGPIGNGTLQGDVVTCPWHGWQYHVKSGQHCLTPRIQQERFEVIVRGDDVYVLMDEGSGAP